MPVLEYSSEKLEAFFKEKSKPLVHKCHECPYFTTSVFSIINHSKHHWTTPKLFDCFECIPEPYVCKDCNYTTQLTTVFNNHIKNHYLDKKPEIFKCPKCDFHTLNASKWQTHQCKPSDNEVEFMQNHQDFNEENVFACHHCLFVTKYKGNLVVHLRNEHGGENIRWFKCDLCPLKFKFKNNLRQHVVDKHTSLEDIKWFQCDHCPYKAKRKHRLITHSLIHNKENDLDMEWFQCDQCDYSTNNNEHLEKHSVVHRSEKSSMYKCNQCSFEAVVRSNVYNHARSCHNRGPFHCDKCSFTSNRSDNLKQHVINKHSVGMDTEWFQCDLCSFKTKNSKAYLKRHQRRMHNCKK